MTFLSMAPARCALRQAVAERGDDLAFPRGQAGLVRGWRRDGNGDERARRRIEAVLARALAVGTWLISAVIAAGLLLSFFPARMPYAWQVVMIGIGLFVLLPITRVILMLALFAGIREYKFAAVAGLVLAIILASLVIGVLYK